MEFYQNILYLHVPDTARLQPSKSSTPTIVSNIFANSQTTFRFRFFTQKEKPRSRNNRPNIVDLSYRGRTARLHFGLAPQQGKAACTVISRSFARSVDIMRGSCNGDLHFGHRGKFHKLFNNRGDIISNLGYLTSFPGNQKQQSRNRIHWIQKLKIYFQKIRQEN